MSDRILRSVLVSALLAVLAPAQTTLDGVPRVGVGVVQRRLTLEEAVQMALKNNLDIEIERANRDIAAEAVIAAQGAFDPIFRYQPQYVNAATPTGSVLQAPDGRLVDRSFTNNAYLLGRLGRYGTNLQLGFENARTATTNPFVSLNPFNTSRLVFSVTQPLLRGRAVDRERTEIRVRQRQERLSALQFEGRVIEVVSRVEQAYWDLVAARQGLQVNREFVELGRQQLELNQRLVKAGTLAPVELTAAEAELQRRLDTFYTSLGAVTELENALKAQIVGTRNDALWNDEILPVESKAKEPPAIDNVAERIDEAVRRRPELRAASEQIEVNRIQQEFSAEQRRPQLNLVAAYTNQGLGGLASTQTNPFGNTFAPVFTQLGLISQALGLPALPPQQIQALPASLVGGYGTALSNVFSGSYQTYQAGLQFDWNFRNRTANSLYAQDRIAGRRLQTERARTEQSIAAQVRNALQGIQTARQRISAAEASARAAQEKQESETRLYQAGESTNFLVLTRQNELTDSRRRVVVANLELNKAISRLEQAIGTTLSTYQISVP